MKFFKTFLFNNYNGILLFFVAVGLCHFTGSRGVFPIDSFAHYDSGYRVLNGEHPFKDYWVVSGPFVDYLQSIVFYIFGTSWQSYILNSSIINGIITLSTYYLFINLGLKKNLSFFYSICFAILAYPSSGTPFVDHHSAFLSILAIYSLIFALKTNKNFFWFLIPIFIILAFLSKQVPSTYIFFSIAFMILLHFSHQDKKNIINTSLTLFMSSILTIIIIFSFFKINSIPIENFITQYLLYPSTIGSERYELINYNFKNVFSNFKFIYFSLFILLLLSFKNSKIKKDFFVSFDFKLILISILSFISLVQHLIVTKNQIFIFFLIPLFLGFAHIHLKKFDGKKKFLISLFTILFCTIVTIKYHYRFNIDRKFHELNEIKFSDSIDAQKISKEFKGLNWITPKMFRNYDTDIEIDLLNNFKEILESDKNNKFVMTNYSFFSTIIGQNVSSHTRWYPGDNSAFPVYGNEFYEDYKRFITETIVRRKINTIYILPDVNETNLINYLSFRCFDRFKLEMGILKFIIRDDCTEISLK